MSFVIFLPDAVETSATQLASIGAALSEARTAAAPRTTALVAAAEDEVSPAVPALFSDPAQQFQALGAQAASFHTRFVQGLTAGAESYRLPQAAHPNPLPAPFSARNGPP